MFQTSDLRKGLKIEIDGEPFIVSEAQFVKPGKGNAFTRCKIKSMTSGRVLEKTWKSGESIHRADLEDRDMQYLYSDGGRNFTFMDMESYDQLEISAEQLGDAVKWMIENLDVQVLFHNGKPINVELPNFVDMEITHCEPGVKGDTAQGATKPATLSTGAIVYVPLFINEGETIRIDTRSGDYTAGPSPEVPLRQDRPPRRGACVCHHARRGPGARRPGGRGGRGSGGGRGGRRGLAAGVQRV